MADKITFLKTLNTSLQKGDELYYSDIITGTAISPISLGEITDKGDKWVEVANAPTTTGMGDFVTNGGFDPTFGPEKIVDGDMGYYGVNELGTTGTFDTDINGWTIKPGAEEETDASWVATNGGEMQISSQVDPATTVGDHGVMVQEVTGLIPQEEYTFSYECTSGVMNFVHLYDSLGGNYTTNLGSNSTGIHTFTFNAIADTIEIHLGVQYQGTAFTANFDNVSLNRTSTPTTWNLNSATLISGEAFVQIDASGSFASISQVPIGGYTPGSTYKVTFDAWGTDAYDIRVQSDPSNGAGGLSNANALFQPTTTRVTYEFIWTANANCTSIAFERNSNLQISWDFYIDNVSVQEVTTADWSPDATWEKAGAYQLPGFPGAFGHINTANGGGSGYLEQQLTTPLVEGEEYNITFDVVGGDFGDVLLANTAPGNTNVTIVIPNTDHSGLSVTYTQSWVQGSNNNNILKIYQGASSNRVIDNVSVVDTSTTQAILFMFRKPVDENVSSLKGYYAESTFTNDSTEKQELFSVGSEITISSK